jgi:hypothetical protein
MTTVLSPRPSSSGEQFARCAPVGPLRGKKVGLRRDYFWRSWDWVTDEWAQALRADGAEPIIWRAPVGKGEKKLVEGGEEFEQFLGEIDVMITGLCNCGSCTLWAIHDGVVALDRKLPTVSVSTQHFESLARTLAGQRGHTDIRVKLLPYPLEGRLEDEVREIARENYDSLLDALGAVR